MESFVTVKADGILQLFVARSVQSYLVLDYPHLL